MSLARATLDDPRAANPLLSAEGAADLLRRSGVILQRATPNYVRLKPGAGVLIGYRLHGRGPDGAPVERPAYVRVLPPARAASVAAKWARMRPASTPFGPGFRPLADGRSILFVFPTDARLRQLPIVGDGAKLKRVLAELPDLAGFRVRGRRSTFTAVRYKPERRFIVAADLAITDDRERRQLPVFLRLFPDARGAHIAATAEGIRAAAGGGLVPRPLGALLGGSLFVEEHIEGVELADAVVVGVADPDAMAEALGRLHAVSPPPSLPRRSAASLVGGLAEGLSTMAGVAPGLGAPVNAVLRLLQAARPAEDRATTIHGDLHLHQVIVRGDGPVLVDLERAAIGDPFQDVGELAAHLDELTRSRPESAERVRRFRDAVVEASLAPVGGSARAQSDFRFFLGAALANRALLPFRRLEDGWPERSEALLELAAAAMEAR